MAPLHSAFHREHGLQCGYCTPGMIMGRARPADPPTAASAARRVVLLVDVSGSMAGYADVLLRFAHAASHRRVGATEVFTLGTRLTRITDELAHPDVDSAMRAVSTAIPDWEGGTRLGPTLREFLDRWGQRGTARGAVRPVGARGRPTAYGERGDGRSARPRILGGDAVREELPTLRRWQADGARFGLATVVATSRSAPRQPGATLALHPDGDVLGSVSGGCVEGAVVEVATEVLATGIPQRVSYGISDDDAFSVGLTCGGTIEVFVRPVTRDTVDLDDLATRIASEEPIALATVVAHPDDPDALGRAIVLGEDRTDGSTGNGDLDHAIVQSARGMLAQGATGLRHFGADGERRKDEVAVMVESFAPRPRMLVFGAIDFAGAVASVGRFLGYQVTVCDARARFATPARFPDADEVVVEWPHRYLAATEVDARTAICVLTHDPKFDVPVLKVALATDAAYVGVMGSRRTHDDRVARLREEGVTAAQLERLRSPIGLDLGARTPQETAVSIAAELVMLRHGGTGDALTHTDGPIHRERSPLGA